MRRAVLHAISFVAQINKQTKIERRQKGKFVEHELNDIQFFTYHRF